jgi:O-6-methylguanine DNA methyltransferase
MMEFEKAVKSIPEGRVSTYGLVARSIGSSPRAVGQMLKRSKGVPCHRVVRSDGTIGGYKGTMWEEKMRILRREGIRFKGKSIVSFDKLLFDPKHPLSQT